MDPTSNRSAAMRAGIAGGLAGLLVFLLLHQLWIAPIWFIAPMGAILAAAGGAAVGAAYAELWPRLPRRPLTAPVVLAVFASVLAPAFLLAEAWGPTFAMGPNGSGILLVPGTDVAIRFVVGLVGTAVVVAAGLGWAIARSRRAAGTMAVAGVALALGPGHNIPLLGGTGAVTMEVAILSAVLGVAALTLVEAHAWLLARG